MDPFGVTNLKADLEGMAQSAFSARASANPTVKSPEGLAWIDNPVHSIFFKAISIDPDRWDQLFTYRLIVIDITDNNGVVGRHQSVTVNTTLGASGSAIIDFTPFNSSWIFNLPISPQQLSIADQYAISTSATLRGVVEEHSGVRFKMIQASGTMGVWPFRPSVKKPPSSPNIIQSVFGGTISAFNNVVSQVKSVINIATSNHPAEKPTTILPAQSDAGETSTGYYQAMALTQFLEQYAEAKKDPDNAGWRLVFDIPKQKQSFIVTPVQFQWQQNQNKPLEISYSFQLKAWRRIDLENNFVATMASLTPLSPGILQRIMQTISQARRVMSASTDLIGAVRSDVTAPFEALRQTTLLLKDFAGFVTTAADLPNQIQKDINSSIQDSLNNLGISSTTTDSGIRSTLKSVSDSSKIREGISADSAKAGQIGTDAAAAQSANPLNNVFNSPEKNFAIMDLVSVQSLKLNPAQQDRVDAALDVAKTLTVDDLKGFRNTIKDLSLQLSNYFGTGDAYYNKMYGLPAPKVRLQPITLDEYAILNSLYNVLESYDILTATTDLDDRNKQSNMDYVASLASASDITFNTTQAKTLVPVPFGLTVEAISARYLGDPQRWLEIVTLNNLRAPYIDETGFQYPLLSNASGRQITVAFQDNLYVGQRVILYSSSQTPNARRILGLDRLSDTSFLLTLDGDADLDNFTTVDKAYLQAYLPGTVNSQQKLYIPSAQGVANDPKITPPSSVSADPLVGLSKADLLLTETGDLAVNSFGDFRISAGITNIIQALRIKVGTKKGTNLLHSGFGLGIAPGINAADVRVQDIYDSINKMIQDDPRFQSLNSLQIQLNGPVMTINMAVTVAGQGNIVPVTFTLTN